MTDNKEETNAYKSESELPIIPQVYKLNGKKYLKWPQLVITILKGKGKAKHLTDAPPEEKDPKFDNTSKEIWKSLEETYSKAKDVAQIYDVKVKTLGTKQGNKIVTKYTNHLKALRMELFHYRINKIECTTYATKLREYIEQDRVYDFVVGLNSNFDYVRVQILDKEKVPNINDVVSIVRSEESRRELMLTPPSVERSTLLLGKSSTMLVD
ncbi:hypothetical protein KIW84_053639 [Lathyrus oleraceus]|uniref:UBN2 domain-containing protein n=1 Tax=Pisum sativum TaxID=3888 RepID=A0A9D5AGG8_PEA|nr:hypothetical protein KIW84_053639 [Pisum sativum]